MRARRWLVPDLLELGDRDEADRQIEVCSALATETRQPLYRWCASVFRGSQALLDGRFHATEGLIEEAYATGEQVQSGTALIYYRAQCVVLYRELGRLSELAAWLAETAAPTMPILWCCQALLACEEDTPAEAVPILDRLALDEFRAIRRDLTWLSSVAILAEVCASTRAGRHAAVLYDQMLPYARRNAMMGIPVCWGSVSRSVGLLAATFGRWDAAERHFHDALAANLRLRAPAWAARTRYDYGRMLRPRRRPDDQHLASTLLVDALQAAQTMAMPRLMQQAEVALVGATGLTDAPESADSQPGRARLTARECEVLRLIALGNTTRQIAATLVVSPATVERHITNVYAKIGARGRADATAYALSNQIAPLKPGTSHA